MRADGLMNQPMYQSSPSPQVDRTESMPVEKTRESIKSLKILPTETVQVQPEEKQVSEHEVIQAIEKANKHIRSFDRRLEFSIHDATKQIIVKVIDTENDNIIREIPSEKILDMVAHLWEMAGLLVDEKR